MNGINKAIILGTLGRDPEVRETSGGAVTTISVATRSSWKDKQGEQHDATEWHRVVAFGKLAEIMAKYLKKGAKVYIEGGIKTREWEKDGVKHYTTEIIAKDMQMLGDKGEQTTPPAREDSKPQQSFDDDTPF